MKRLMVWLLLGGMVFILAFISGGCCLLNSDPDYYEVIFHDTMATGGTVPAPQTKARNVDLTLATNSGNLVRTGFIFAGWNTQADGNGKDFAEGAKYTDNAPVTLYAKWRVPQVGELGQAGGYVFYDKGSYSNGWRYLEAAPAGWSGTAEDPWYYFGYHRPSGTNLEVVTATEIGSGKGNTEALVSAMGSAAYQNSSGPTTTAGYAAKICEDYSRTAGGLAYDDWFLPSKDELNQMYDNLQMNNLGGFSSSFYWSSSEFSDVNAWYQAFQSGSQINIGKASGMLVRPARAF